MARRIRIAKIFWLGAACLLLYASSAPTFAQDPAAPAGGQTAGKQEVSTLRLPPGFALEDGTPVRLRLTADLSSANATVGQTIDFKVVEAIKVKDVVVIPEGGIAWATVTEAQHKRHLGRGGKLNITIDKVRLADGERAPLRAVKEAQGGGHVGAMTTGIVATGILFFPVAPLFLFMHGKDITIPAGTEVTAYVNGDFSLERARFLSSDASPAETAPAQDQPPPAAPGSIAQSQPPAAAVPPAAGQSQPTATSAPAAAPPAESQATVEVAISSSPPGAEIILDGKFVGNTPSTLRFAPGDHSIRIEKAGFKPWEKPFTAIVGGAQSLNAVLEPQ